jgi:VWFA-related protein
VNGRITLRKVKKGIHGLLTSAALLILAGFASFPAKAQNPAPSSENLPSKPDPVSNSHNFKPMNPYVYPNQNQTPNIPTYEPMDTTPEPLATQLEPFDASASEPATEALPVAQKNIRVYTNEVIVPVTALNSRGELVLDLARKNFHVFDRGVEQPIDRWELGGDPLAVALVLETSTHIEMMAPVIRGIGSIFTETVMALDGEAAVITYDSTVEVRQPFTQDHDAVARAIAKLDFEAPEARLYDAMSTSVDMLKQQSPRFRRVMLIIGESQDYLSDSKLGLVLREAQLSNIAIYALGPSSTTADLRYGADGLPTIRLPGPLPSVTTGALPHDPLNRPQFTHPELDLLTPAIWLIMRGTNEIQNHQLEVAAAATGGVHYRALRDSTIRSALDRIGAELHAQYILTYLPAGERSAGFHEIKVSVERPGVTVRARPGYFLAEEPN